MIQTDPNGGSLKCRHRCAQILSKPFNCKIIHQRNCSAHQVHMLRIWSAKAEIFPWKLQRTQGREKRKIALIWTKTVRCWSCIIYNYAPLGQVKSFLIRWTKIFACNIHIFSPNISDKLVSITSFKASPLSLLDVSSSKERAAASLIVRYLVSGDGDIMSYRGH